MERVLGMFNLLPVPKLIFFTLRVLFRPSTGGVFSYSSSMPVEAGIGALESFSGRFFFGETLGYFDSTFCCLLRLKAISYA